MKKWRRQIVCTAIGFLVIGSLYGQHQPFSIGLHFESNEATSNIGATIAYHPFKFLSIQGEIRNRTIDFGRLETPCLVLDSDKYPDLAFMNPEQERIIMLPEFSGTGPLALGLEVKTKKRFGPFLRVRGEVVRYKFRVTTVRQLATSGGWFGPSWSSGKEITHQLDARRIAGSLQTGLSLTTKGQCFTFKAYVSLDSYSTSNVEVFMPIPGYPSIEPIRIRLSDHFGNRQTSIGVRMQFNFGVKWIGTEEISK